MSRRHLINSYDVFVIKSFTVAHFMIIILNIRKQRTQPSLKAHDLAFRHDIFQTTSILWNLRDYVF